MSVEERALAQSLAKHEKIIERGTLVFIEVGNALAAIRDEQLYKLSYKTFEDYVLKRWGFSRPRAYQLIEASEVTRNLYTIVDKTALPPNEAQLREIAKAPKEKQAEVVTKAAERAAAEDRKPTAKDYKEVVSEIVYEDAPEPEDEETDEQPEQPAPKPPKGKPEQSVAQFCDQISKQHIGPLARDLLSLAKMTGGQDGEFQTAKGHLDSVLQYVKARRK